MSDLIDLEWKLSRSAVVAADGLHLVLMARIKAAPDPSLQRAPLNIGLVLDRSGSMAGDKLEQCKFAARFVASQMSDTDRLAVVVFDSDVKVLVAASEQVNGDKVRGALATVHAGSSTNLSGGWLEGAQQVETGRDTQHINRVLLLTDGQANQGVVAPEQLLSLAQKLLGSDIHTTCIGFGADFNENLLQGIADAGGGNFHFIKGPEETRSVFARELQGLLSVAAQNLRLRIAPSKDVQQVSLMQDFPVKKLDNGGLEVEMGDVLAGTEKLLLVDLLVPSKLKGRKGITALTLTFQQVLGNVALKELNAFVETPDGAAAKIDVDPVVWRQVVLNDAARAMMDAQKDADAGNLDGARSRLEDAGRSLSGSPYAKDADYQEQIHELERLRGMLENQHRYQTEGRKSLVYSGSSVMRSSSFVMGGLLPPDVRKQLATCSRLVFVTDQELADISYPPPADPDAVAQWRRILQCHNLIRKEAKKHAHAELGKLARSQRFDEIKVLTTAADGLHLMEGEPPTIEMFGSLWQGRCPADGQLWAVCEAGQSGPPLGERKVAEWKHEVPVCSCGQALVPHLMSSLGEVEAATLQQAKDALASCQAVVVGGKLLLADLLEPLGKPVVWISPQSDAVPTWVTHQMPIPPAGGLFLLIKEIMWY